MSSLKVRRNIDIVKVLENIGVQNIIASEDRVRSFCPIHKSDKQRSLSFIKDDSGIWRYKCFQCESKGDVFDFIKTVKKCNFKQALDFINHFIIHVDLSLLKQDVNIKKSKVELKVEDILLTKEMIPYLKKRGILEKNFDEFQFGVCYHHHFLRNRIVFPVFEDHTKKFYIGRKIDEYSKYPRYLYYPEGIKKSDYLFNYDCVKSADEIIICEGIFDAIQISNFGFSHVVALFGSSISKKQEEKIWELNAENLVLCFDGDKKGFDIAYDVANLFLNKDVRVMLFNTNLDPAEITYRDFEKLYKNAFTGEEYINLYKTRLVT